MIFSDWEELHYVKHYELQSYCKHTGTNQSKGRRSECFRGVSVCDEEEDRQEEEEEVIFIFFCPSVGLLFPWRTDTHSDESITEPTQNHH